MLKIKCLVQSLQFKKTKKPQEIVIQRLDLIWNFAQKFYALAEMKLVKQLQGNGCFFFV